MLTAFSLRGCGFHRPLLLPVEEFIRVHSMSKLVTILFAEEQPLQGGHLTHAPLIYAHPLKKTGKLVYSRLTYNPPEVTGALQSVPAQEYSSEELD